MITGRNHEVGVKNRYAMSHRACTALVRRERPRSASQRCLGARVSSGRDGAMPVQACHPLLQAEGPLCSEPQD